MSANTNPIFSITPNTGMVSWTNSTTANTKSDGTGTIGTDILKVFTAGANGAFVEKIRLVPNGSTASTATTATVGRVYRSTKASGSTTNADTFRWDEVPLPSQVVDVATSSTNIIEIPLGFGLAPNETILISMHHAAAANTSWAWHCIGGDY